MSSEAPVEVAANSSATAEDPRVEGEAAAYAEEVESTPLTAETATGPIVSWADASEEVQSTVLSLEEAPTAAGPTQTAWTEDVVLETAVTWSIVAFYLQKVLSI